LRERFETLVDEARGQEPADAAKALRRALELWSGPPLAQLAYEPFAERAIADLEERRLQALEDRIEADLQLGQDRELVPELERLVREQPLRERPASLLMLALYRSGRQADALEAYQNARRRLVDELGLEPSPALQQLRRQILAHDEALAGPPRPRVAARRRKGGLPIVAGGVALLAAGIAAGVVELTSSSAPELTSVAANSVAVVDPGTNRLVAQVRVGSAPSAIAFGDGGVWAANTGESTVSRIDPKTRRLEKTIALPGPPSGLAVLGRNLWVLFLYQRNEISDPYAGDAGLAQIDTSADDLFGSFRLNAGFSNDFEDSVAAARGELWAVDAGAVSRVDPVRSRIVARIPLEIGTRTRIAAGFDSLWLPGSSAVYRIDPRTNAVVATIPITGGTGPGPSPNAVATGEGAVWVANRIEPPSKDPLHHPFPPALPGNLSRIDPKTNAVVATIPVGRYSIAVAVGGGAVWVANRDSGTLSRIDPRTNSLVKTIRVGGHPQGITFGDGAVWVTVG
jgi:YVTN family beta-propeller protein